MSRAHSKRTARCASNVAQWPFALALCWLPFCTGARILDDFESLESWQGAASDGVRAAVRSDAGHRGRALRLDFDFSGVGGYAIARRSLPLDYPPNFEISFYLRAASPVNNLEIKLIDSSGENVWWMSRRDFAFPSEWQQIRIKRRQIEFAWGPTPDRTLTRTATLELVVSAGSGGGSGSVWFDDLELRERPVPSQPPTPPIASATSSRAGAEARLALDSDRNTAWFSADDGGTAQKYDLDLREQREFGGLVLHWLDDAHARRYDVQLSESGKAWRTVRSVHDGNGGTDFLYLPESEARFVRLALHDGPGRHYGLAEIDVRDLAFGASPNAFFENIARAAPRGHYPRGFRGEQPYWTVIGLDGGESEGMLSEDGALEVGKGAFTIEPFVIARERLVTWADVRIRHSLLDEYLPIPSVTWQHEEFALEVAAFAAGTVGTSRLIARYDVSNALARPQTITLALALRPFQVNPPTQFLNAPGGVSPIERLAWNGLQVEVNGEHPVFTLAPADAFQAAPFDAATTTELAMRPVAPATRAVADPTGFASGVLQYRLSVPAHGTATVALIVPLDGPAAAPELRGLSAERWLDGERDSVAAEWRTKLNRVTLRLPPQASAIANTLRTALAHVLINRDGAGLQPGSRSYERSWIRDGALTSSALLRLGHEESVRDFARWYAERLFANGKVPCCVDRRGADPVPENDSHGEFIFLAAETWRYTHDRALLESLWPRVEAAAGYMDSLRRTERVQANRSRSRKAFFGLLPPSISHEGYSDRPAYSYWDNFWALKGYEDAVEIAGVLGRRDAARRLAASRDEFRRDLYASLTAATAAHGIRFLPGSADRGDFDATSTTIAFDPGAELTRLPDELVHATFERYWQEFAARRDGVNAWDAYTPYELRTVGTFVRLGWYARAHELLDFFMASRRPAGWNQWAEVVGRDPREPRFIGDMPHGWVASDFIRSTLDLFAYERPADSALVVAAGIPQAWTAGDGVAIENLRTPHGPLSYTLRRDARRTVLRISDGLTLPEGGIVIVATDENEPRSTTVNGESARWSGRELRIRRLPAEVLIEERAPDSEPENVAGEDFSVWEADIRTFENTAEEHPEPSDAVVFVGSSSITLWSSLKQDMSPIPVIQRGFGGSTLGAVAHYAERLVNVHKPRAVVVFAGSNDITPQRAVAPEELLRLYRQFVDKVRASLPEVPIYYVAITPSPSRWAVWNVARRANELIEGHSQTIDGLNVIDFTRQLLGPNGEPDPKYYQADGLHMSEAGYEIWAREIRRRLLRDLPEFDGVCHRHHARSKHSSLPGSHRRSRNIHRALARPFSDQCRWASRKLCGTLTARCAATRLCAPCERLLGTMLPKGRLTVVRLGGTHIYSHP